MHQVSRATSLIPFDYVKRLCFFSERSEIHQNSTNPVHVVCPSIFLSDVLRSQCLDLIIWIIQSNPLTKRHDLITYWFRVSGVTDSVSTWEIPCDNHWCPYIVLYLTGSVPVSPSVHLLTPDPKRFTGGPTFPVIVWIWGLKDVMKLHSIVSLTLANVRWEDDHSSFMTLRNTSSTTVLKKMKDLVVRWET